MVKEGKGWKTTAKGKTVVDFYNVLVKKSSSIYFWLNGVTNLRADMIDDAEKFLKANHDFYSLRTTDLPMVLVRFNSGYTRDHEASGKGEKRGFYIVSFDNSVNEIKFVPIQVCTFVFKDLDVEGKNAHEAGDWLEDNLEAIDVGNKVVMLRVRGELSGGKTSDINFGKLKQSLVERGAISVYVNKYGLRSKEFAAIRVAEEDVETIENRLLKENIGTIKVSDDGLKGEDGLKLAVSLLKVLRRPAKAGESKQNYEERMRDQGIETLGLKEMFST